MGADDLVLEAEVEEVEDLFEGGALVGEQVLYRVYVVLVPLELEARWVRLARPPLLPEERPVQQIVDFLVVDLHEGDVHADLPLVGLLGRLNLLEELPRAALHQARGAVVRDDWELDALLVGLVLVALHGEGLARACLAVGEDGRVEALHHLADHERHVALFEDLLLRRAALEHAVKAVDPRLLAQGLRQIRHRLPRLGHRVHSMRSQLPEAYSISFCWSFTRRQLAAVSCSSGRNGRTRTITRILFWVPDGGSG